MAQTIISRINFTSDYLLAILNPHTPFNPLPSPYVRATSKIIDEVRRNDIRWYLN